MNRYIYILVFSLSLFSAYGQETAYKNLNSQVFHQDINALKGTLLDVRTPSEFGNGHIDGAGLLNYYTLDFKQKLLLLPKDQPVYLYCNTGYRSKRAAQILSENGFKQVYNLEHGIMDWNLNDLPVVLEPNANPNEDNKMEVDEFYALIKSDKPVFIDFYAPWCAPCRKMMPMMDSLRTEFKDKVSVVKINVDASKRLVKKLQIGSVPYLVLYKQGVMAFEHHGIIPRKELESLFEDGDQTKS